MHRRTVLAATTGALVLSAGCLSGGDDESRAGPSDLPTEATIEVADRAFSPTTVHIAPGGSVTWENTGEEPYRVDSFQFQAESSNWRSREELEPGESITHTFDEEGRYDFTDQVHRQYTMCGRVRVGNVDEGRSLPCE